MIVQIKRSFKLRRNLKN